MTDAPPVEPADAVPCYRCGYDVRAQPADGQCPECGEPVERSRQLASVPQRPAWRDSDPRWRRRMLAGTWGLVLVILLPVLHQYRWGRSVPAPAFAKVQGSMSLADTMFPMLFPLFGFCVAVVLLFSVERNRRRERFDRTRRWGVAFSYGVLLLGLYEAAFITALVLTGMTALFHGMPAAYQPRATGLISAIGPGSLRYLPLPSTLAEASLTACSALVMLLTCVPLFNALRSSGPRWLALLVLLPIALGSVAQLASAALYGAKLTVSGFVLNLSPYYFSPTTLTEGFARFGWSTLFQHVFLLEAAKSLSCLAIALWVTAAQLAARRSRRRPKTGEETGQSPMHFRLLP